MSSSSFSIGGWFHLQCFDKDGAMKWQKWAKNGVTNEGLNNLLDVYFHETAATHPFYIGLIKTTATLAAGDTLAAHAGWTEAVVTTDYTGNRKDWAEGAASSQSMVNAATVDFSILTSITLKGAFLCSAASGNVGILFCTAAFTGGDQAVVNGDTVKVTYTVNAVST